MKEIVSIFLCGKMYGVDIENIQGIENYTDVIRTGGEPGCLDGFGGDPGKSDSYDQSA